MVKETIQMQGCQEYRLCDLATVKFEEMDRRWTDQLISLQRAVDKAEEILKVRLEAMNQFREQLSKERLEYMTRRESILISIIVSLILVVVGAFVTHIIVK